jgi:hypothetical protein
VNSLNQSMIINVMKKLTLLLLLVVSSNVFAEWVFIETDDGFLGGSSYYYDKSTVKRNGDVVRVNTLIDAGKFQLFKNTRYFSMIIEMKFDCNNLTQTTLSIESKSGHMGSGKTINYADLRKEKALKAPITRDSGAYQRYCSVNPLTLEEQLNKKNASETIVRNKNKLIMENTVYLSCLNINHGNIIQKFFYNGNVSDGTDKVFIEDPFTQNVTFSKNLTDAYLSKDYVIFDKIIHDKELVRIHAVAPYKKDNNLITWSTFDLQYGENYNDPPTLKRGVIQEYHADTNKLYFNACEGCPIVTFQCEIKSEKKDIQ